MQCRAFLCNLFCRLVEDLLAGEKILCATVAMKGGGFPASVRSRKDCSIVEINRENREGLAESLEKRIRKLF